MEIFGSFNHRKMNYMNPQLSETIFYVINIVVGICIGLIFSYYQQKVKNKATEEDIKKITKNIEEVKSELGILTHKQISLSSEKQNCLLVYYDKLNKWVNYITYLDLTDHSESPNVYFLDVQKKMNKLYYDYLSAETKVDIFFINDKDLLNAGYLLKKQAMELSGIASQYLIKARTEAQVYQIILSSNDILPNNNVKNNQILESGKKQVDIIKEYGDARNELIKIVSKLNYKLLEILNDRVMNLI